MLTVKQPPTYGYKSIHDLPTPPSTSRPSPPLAYQQEPIQSPLPAIPRSHSPSYQSMSAPHRGLPPPAAMTLPPQPSQIAPGPSSHHSQHPPPPPSIPQVHSQSQHPWSTLPAPPQQWQGAEESMRNWLQARTEEEKTRQEEERTRQETLRLEQRKIEMDILRASLGGGIPPPMVPLVFAGMGTGGVLPQAALEWAQQYMQSSQAHHSQHAAAPSVALAAEAQRDVPASAHGQYPGPPALPASTPSSAGYAPYSGSPTRPRGQTLPGATPRPILGTSSVSSLGGSVPQSSQGSTTNVPPHASHTQTQPPPAQQESSPSIYFHHWQPPTSQAGASVNRPGSPSGEIPKKRKVLGPQPPGSAFGEQQRFRSPPPSHHGAPAESPQQKGHKRQRSEVSWYQQSEQRQPPGPEHYRGISPTMPRDRDRPESRKPSVTSLLSGEPDDAGAGPQQAKGHA
jgi:hypothetical protein